MKKVVIDPGHGGKYPGAISADGRHKEKDIALAIARAIHGKEPKLPGVRFAYTRLGDEHFSDDPVQDLVARVKLANSIKADLFVSIHLNADVQRKGRGAETYYYSDNNYSSVEGRKLAVMVQKALTGNTGLYDRGIKPGRFFVIRYTNMPAVLVEAGFIGGDPAESEYVTRPDTISKIAEGIMMGIAHYLGIKYGPAPAQDPLVGAVKALHDAGIINNQDYWLQNARPGKQVNGEYAGLLIQRFAEKLKGMKG